MESKDQWKFILNNDVNSILDSPEYIKMFYT